MRLRTTLDEGRKNPEIFAEIRTEAEKIRSLYPVGTRVELLQLDDPNAPSVGTRGTVIGVDDLGSILMAWDNGCRLSVIHGKDEVKKVDS